MNEEKKMAGLYIRVSTEVQARDDRKINNYFSKIANDNKHDLAVEIIIELGNMYYWSDKTIEEKYKMVSVFEKQVIDLEKLIPSFKVANATIHFDESSPHLHIIGVPFKDNCKRGLERQVGKSTIFTKESLTMIQDKMKVLREIDAYLKEGVYPVKLFIFIYKFINT